MNIWARLAKDAREKANGRIVTWPGYWRLHGNKDGKPPIRFADRTDDLGRPQEMAELRCVRCPHPKWEPTHARYKKLYWVPWKLCKNCEHYRKGGHRRRIRYPTCLYKAAINPEKQVAKDLDTALTDAIGFANSIMGRPKHEA